MPDPVAAKAKKHARKAPTKGTGTPKARGAASASPRDRLSDLEQECARLKAELAAAKSRLQELEAQRETLVNRIDWVIDSLHTLTEE